MISDDTLGHRLSSTHWRTSTCEIQAEEVVKMEVIASEWHQPIALIGLDPF
jgi:hypothetical protein